MAKLHNSLYAFLCQPYVAEHLASTIYLFWGPIIFVKLVNVAVENLMLTNKSEHVV